MAHSEAPIERLALADLADAEALVAEAGWNQVAADWRIFLDFGTAYAVRAGGRVIATAATLPYGRCAWISMVLVSAAHRRQGLATRLLHRCISDIEASGLVPVLDATPAGAKVYAPLGFEAAWGFTRLAAQRHSIEAPQADAIAIRPIADADWAALCAYDVAIFGAAGAIGRAVGTELDRRGVHFRDGQTVSAGEGADFYISVRGYEGFADPVSFHVGPFEESASSSKLPRVRLRSSPARSRFRPRAGSA